MKKLLFENIDISQLAGKTVILDIDGTLVEDGSLELTPERAEKLSELASRAYVFLATNKPLPERNRDFAALVALPLLTGLRKPDPRIIDRIPEEYKKDLVVIGDKASIDGRLARNVGAKFIYTAHIYKPGDSALTYLFYFLDSVFSVLLRWI
ncbi:hypothetical protein KW785_00490 [Candidatus Parcubacteria bacterium]|nr:hypothetical protein [Candidatus Parcubacteria bacterium]